MVKAVDLQKTYGKKVQTHALKGVSLEIPAGTFCCIVGPSGHGKSTLLQLIGGLDKPTAGSVFIDGTDISTLTDNQLADVRGEKIGFVFQFFNLLENLTALENIQTSMMFAHKARSRARIVQTDSTTGGKRDTKRAEELLKMVGLGDKLHSKPSELSGGQMQRVAIARALANDPPLLLMDEPTGNLDSESEKEVMELIFDIHKTGKTVVFVTHSREIAAQAEMVLEIRDGVLA